MGMPARGPSRPLRRMAGSRVTALYYGPPLSGGRRPLTHSRRREVVSGPATPRVPTPRLVTRMSGVDLTVGPAVKRQLGRGLFGMPARGVNRSVFGSSPFCLRLLSSSVGMPATPFLTDPHSTMTSKFTLKKRASNLDKKVELSGNTLVFTLAELSTSIELCLIELHRCTVANREDDERLTESRKVQFRHITIDLFRPEVNVSFAGLGFLPIPEKIMLRQNLVREEHDIKKEGCQWRPLESSDVSDMMCVCVQMDPSAHAVPLVGAMNPRSATLETSISATGDSSTLVFASTTSAEVEIGLMFEVHWHANKVEPITTVAVVPLMKQTSFANSVLCLMDRSAVAVVLVGPNSSGLRSLSATGRHRSCCRGFSPRPQHIMLRHLFRERTRHPEGRMASGSRGLMLRTFMPSKPSELAKSISSKCPVFPTSEMFLRFFMWSKALMLKLPVEETKTSV